MAQLCRHVGIEASYRGFDKQDVVVSEATQRAVLQALGLDVNSEAEARAHLSHLKAADAKRPLPPEVVVRAGQSCELQLAQPAEWQLDAEATGAHLASGKSTDCLALGPLPLGIHALRLRTSGGDFTTWVLARPARARCLGDTGAGSRNWGVTTALYGLTNGDAAPIGSYGLLGDYAAALANHGADFIGINPVHAMGHIRPDNVISPYSPSHRAFLNTWHCGAGSTPGSGNQLLDYAAALHQTANEHAEQFACFRRLPEASPEKQAFRAFVAAAGKPLDDFAIFEALTLQFGADWRDWPAPYRDHDAQVLNRVEVENADVLALVKWAQWQADAQLGQAQEKALNAGMGVGLYLDLAIGPRLGGAETWASDTPLVTGATLGAPPDMLEPAGQSWGLAPLSPAKCRAEGFAAFARLLRANMRHAGMIRIDHVIGLQRSFWIPEGGTEGAYVSYPLDAFLAVLAIESARNDTLVVGEDLGLVPDGLRKKLAGSGIYGLDVVQYMRDRTGGFIDTAKTRKHAICAFATHDTPTITGFFAAEDARIRHTLGDIDAKSLSAMQADRTRARETLVTADPVTEIHQQLARANASMVAVQLDDVAEILTQQNLPGTVDTHPNWQRKAPFTVQDIGTSQAFAKIAADMAAEGRSNSEKLETKVEYQDCSDVAH